MRVGLHGLLLIGPPAVWSLSISGETHFMGLVALALWVLGTAGEDHGVGVERRVPWSEQVRALLLLGVLWIAGATAALPASSWGMGGVALFFVGVGLRRWAIHTLGPRFRASVRPSGAYVDTGPYAWLAHPSEVGLAMAALGVVLVSGSRAALLSWPLCVALPGLWRSWQEDRAADAMQRAIGCAR